ncbi:MAG: CotH kinase family protein [Acidobacteria bacterium]|nr:CotH kinase family protein [Acidobacteriota bacterium]
MSLPLPRLVFVFAALALLAARSAAPQAPTADDIFNDGVLHDIRLTMNPRDWESLKANFQLNDYYPAHFTWKGITVRNAGIRSRGLGSRSGTKPGLKVDFNYYTNNQTLLGLTSLVLRNNTQDPSSLHERLSMLLFARMEVPTPRTAHTRLFVNEQYAGLYLIVESVDKRFLKRHFDEDNGYLYKYEWQDAYYFESRGRNPAAYTPKPFQPETNEKNPDPQPIVEMVAAINESPDADFLSAVDPYVDVRRFVVQAAIENFLADNDGLLGYAGMNNFYLYRLQGTRRSTFVPWDKSEAFKSGVTHPIWYNIYDSPAWLRNRLMDRAMNVIELRDVYLDTLLKCAEIVTATRWLEQEALRAYGQIRQAALEDRFKPFSNEEFEADVQHVLEFARARAAFVVAEVRRSR